MDIYLAIYIDIYLYIYIYIYIFSLRYVICRRNIYM